MTDYSPRGQPSGRLGLAKTDWLVRRRLAAWPAPAWPLSRLPAGAGQGDRSLDSPRGIFDNCTVEDSYRSGYVALAGRPNVGKSSLLTALVGEQLWPASAKPQTTRVKQLAILTNDRAQIIFVDTPGLHEPQHRLGQFMNEVAANALADCDLILAMFDVHLPPTDADRSVAARLAESAERIPLLVVLNKMDLVDPEHLKPHWDAFQALCPQAELFGVSATRGDNLDQLLEAVIIRLPLGPQYFSAGELTDRYERDIAGDLIRSAAMDLLREELPYSIAVRIDEYRERDRLRERPPSERLRERPPPEPRGAYIAATLFVERASQKGIVIGKGGRMLREIGIHARKSIEQMSGRKVFLELRVKELPGWRNDPAALRRLGYSNRGSRE